MNNIHATLGRGILAARAICGATCYLPGIWGHKCQRPAHPKAEEHQCSCGQKWGPDA